jgi:serine/threonine protein kinase/Tfp pilus assembly protein PilF
MNSVSRVATVARLRNPRDHRVDDFRVALEQSNPPPLNDFLPAPSDADYCEVLRELVEVEYSHRLRKGQPISLSAYRNRFPELASDAVFALKVAQEELDQAVSTSQTREIGPGRAARKSSGPVSVALSAVPTELPQVGDEFLGFSLLAELGRGAFARVFIAQQGQVAGRLVALKVALGLFAESQTLGQLQHSHIVPIYSYHDGVPYQAVCMPFLGSTTLADVLADIRSHRSFPNSGRDILSTLNDRRKRSTVRHDDSNKEVALDDSLPRGIDPLAKPRPTITSCLELEGMSYVDSILWMGVRLADGLQHAHERGILHRDLKPGNILLTDDGLPMLLDFNLAQDTKQDKESSSIGGTLPYMAPEHLKAFGGKDGVIDARSDVYALGVILYEMLTGAAPYPTYRKLAMREAVPRMIEDRNTPPHGLRELNPSIPYAVEAIVMRCLAGDPKQRYQSARELREDLQCQLEHKPLKHAPNVSLWERWHKFRRRNPRLTSATSVGLAGLVIVCALVAALAVSLESHARLEARATVARFDEDAQSTYFYLHARSAPRQLEEGERACRAALARFDVLAGESWQESATLKRLPDAEQERVRVEVGQLLVVLAHGRQLAADREKDAERRTAILQEGMAFCSLAGECFRSDQTPQALLRQKGELLRRLDDRIRADESFARANATPQRTSQDRYLCARQLAEEGKFRDALPIIAEALRLNPQDYNAHFLEGICHDYLGRPADAIQCYRTCIALKPNFHGAYYNRGLAYLKQNQFKQAKEDFDEVLRLYGDFASTYISRAMAFQGMKKFREAEADFTAALQSGHAETRVYFLRSRVREKLGDKAGAKQDFADGLRRTPDDELSYIARGIAWLPGDPAKALADFDKSLELNPRSLAGMQNKAHVLGKYFKKTEDAVRVLDAAIEHYPDNAQLRAGRGVYFGRLGKRDSAMAGRCGKGVATRHTRIQPLSGGRYLRTHVEDPPQRSARS